MAVSKSTLVLTFLLMMKTTVLKTDQINTYLGALRIKSETKNYFNEHYKALLHKM